MAEGLSESSGTIFPGLSYRDPTAAIAWLEKVFGFRKRLVVPGPDGTIMHSEMSFGPGVIMLGTARPERSAMSPLDLPGLNQSLSVFVEDVDAHYQHAKANGAEIVDEIHDTDYGARGYMAKDLEGHRWYFGNYRPGAYWDDAE